MGPQVRAGLHPAPASWHALVDGEAAPAEALRLARHLDRCDRCRAVRARIAALAADLVSLPAPEEPPDFAAQVMTQVRSVPAPRRQATALRLVAPVVVMLTGGLALLAMPFTGRMLRGFGRLLQPDLLEPSRLLDLLIGVAAAAAGGLGRVVEVLVPRVPTLPAVHGPEAPVAVLLLTAAAALTLATSSMVLFALAGRTVARYRAAKP